MRDRDKKGVLGVYRHAGSRAATPGRGIQSAPNRSSGHGRHAASVGASNGAGMDPGLRRDDDRRKSTRRARVDGSGRRIPITATQRGYLLLPVAVAIALIGVVAFLISRQSAIEVELAAGELETTRAEYVAQAGMQHALRELTQQGCGPYTDLTDYPFGADEYDTKLSHGLGSITTYTVNVDQDTWIRDDQPTNNYAADTNLHIRNEGGVLERPMLRYDLSAIPVRSPILSARAWFYIDKGHVEGPVDIYRISADWIDTDATWDSMGDGRDGAVLASLPAQPNDGVWVAANLTGQVQAWVNGEENFGITIGTAADGVHAEYLSRETAFAPYLEVIVSSPPTSPTKLESTSKLDGGAGASLERDDVMLRQAPLSTRLLQPGPADGKDTYLYEWKPTWNYGASDEIWVDDQWADSTAHGLIRFNLGAIPSGARVVDARLELYQSSPASGGGPVGVYRLEAGWDEGTGSGSNGTSNWTQRTASAAWSDPGGDFDSREYALESVPAGIGWSAWEIGELVDGWVRGRFPNHGLALYPETSGTATSFASSDHADPTLRPKLSVTYTCTCGEVCVAPQGSGKLLMVVINPTTLVAEDQKARDLFESWGYTVKPISENAAQAAFDAEFIAQDVIFISETVNSSLVGNKVKNAPIGVVSQDGDFNPDLGFSESSALTVGDAIDIVDSDHYITRPFAGGPLEIYRAGMEQLTVNGDRSEDLGILAESAGDGSLVVLDTGDALEEGGSAAGRRVMLPLGTRYRFDWDYLNANGRLLVQRALAWGMSADKTSNGNVLLVVVNPANLTAQEGAKKALIEGWGYTVNLIDESDSQANFDAAIAANDVAYIPQDINSSNVGTKLVDAAIGVVNEEGELVDELGFSADKIFKSRREIDVVDNSHYITEPFATGLLTFALSDQSVHMLSGGLAPGLQTLGQSFNTGSLWEPSLATLDPGDDLSGGGTAAGRRVQLPWGGGTFDINQLTDDGRTIMRRALEWGAGTSSPPALDVLLVVGDPAILTTEQADKKTLIEGWGHNVALIATGDDQATFDAAAAAADVVYVPELGSTPMTELGDKADDLPVGVITEEARRALLLGSFALSPFVDADTITITDNSHYLTETLATGPVQLSTSVQSMWVLKPTLALDLHVLGELGAAEPGLAYLETGERRNDGSPAPARRVKLPWGSFNFDVNQLTPDGLEIMRRALEWGAGAGLEGGFYLDEFPDFTCDGADEYRGSNGTLDWSGTAWVESGDDGRACGANLRVLDDPLIDDPSGNRLRLQNSDRAVEREVDIGSFTTAYLSFDYRRDDMTGGAAVLVEVSGDGGGNWDTLATIGPGTDAAYLSSEYDISAYAASDTMIRFASNSSFSGEAYIDNVRIDSTGGSSDPYAHWKLDDGTGLTAVDSEGSNDGTLTNGPNWVAGLLGDALDFDGSNDYVAAGTFDVVGSGITLMGWFNADAIASDDPRIISKASGTNEADAYWQLSTTDSGADRYLRMRIKAGGTTTTLADSSVNLSAGQWYLATATYDNASGEMKLYLDGVEVASGAHAVGGALDTDPSVPVAIGANGTAARFFDGIIDDVRVYNLALDDIEIADLYAASAPVAPGYTELREPWSASTAGAWETVDLASFGVPSNAVVEVAVINADAGKEQWGGVRAVGSSLERRFLLHEPESGGVDAITLHAQTDASSRIEHYSSKTGDVTFVLLGYWTGAAYVERFDTFFAGASGSWQSVSLLPYGVGADQVVELAAANTSSNSERYAGMRRAGSGLDRRLELQEAESGGVDVGAVWVASDASGDIEVFAESNGDIDFYLLGYWSIAPGSFTEAAAYLPGAPAASGSWEQVDLGGLGVPADAVTQILLANNLGGNETEMGVRTIGSGLNRVLDLHEAESGGNDFATQHAVADGAARIEWYDQQAAVGRFILSGWWLIGP